MPIFLNIHEIAERLCVKLNFHSRKKSNQIVLMRLDALGDFIIWQDAAKEFKKKYPYTKISVICQISTVEFARTLPYFDEVCGIDIKRMQWSLNYFFAIFLKMHHYKDAILIQTVYSRTWMMDVISAMIPAYKKISVDGDCDNYPIDKEWHNHIYDRIKHISTKYCLELCRNAAFMRSLGFKGFKSNLPILPDYSLKNKRIYGEYYVIVLGTSCHAKEWDPECYGIVAKFVSQKCHLQCCLLGTEHDKPLAKVFKKTYNLPCIDLISKTNIPEYIQIIREAKLVISGDTSAAHVAAAVKTPCIVITGGWHYGRFFPYCTETGKGQEYFPRLCYYHMDCYQCNRKRIANQCRHDERRTGKWSCILAVTPDMVIKEIEQTVSDFIVD